VSTESSGTAKDFSEHAVTPSAMVVHDPTAFGAFDALDGIADGNALLRASLFRERPDVGALARQHAAFVSVLNEHTRVLRVADLLGKAGLTAHREKLERNPNHVFTHDALITLPWAPEAAILGNMREPLRREEPMVLEEVARALGLREIVRLPAGVFLEGGDVIPLCIAEKRTLLVGFGPRTSEEALPVLIELLGERGWVDEVIGVKLAAWRLNVDGCFFPVSDDTVVAHLESVEGGVHWTAEGPRPIDPATHFRNLGFEIVEAAREESYGQQACNFVCLGGKRLVAYKMTERINDALRERGFDVIGVDGSELVKGNGGPHCMTRPVYSRVEGRAE
jgi:N-dimethylarginine dimethylaminohydrolase